MKLCTETGVISSYPVMQVSGEGLDNAIGLCHYATSRTGTYEVTHDFWVIDRG